MGLERYRDLLGGTRPFEMPGSRYPACVGLYFFTELKNGIEEITYIGSTFDLKQRITKHHHVIKKIKNDGADFKIYIAPCHYAHMRITEGKLIYKIQPARNGVLKKYAPRKERSIKQIAIQISPIKFEVKRAYASEYMKLEVNRRFSRHIH